MSKDIISSSSCGCVASRASEDAPQEQPLSPLRRALWQGALAAGLATAVPGTVVAANPKANRPQAGDLFVFFAGPKAGQIIGPTDLVLGAPPVLAWPLEPLSKTVRDGSRLNLVLLVRLEPSSLDDATRGRATEGIVAYSASCTHALCPVNGWKAEQWVLWCPCHNSEFDPRIGAKVVFGPAPRPLPALPLRIVDGRLTAAGTFLGRVGQTS